MLPKIKRKIERLSPESILAISIGISSFALGFSLAALLSKIIDL